MNTCPECIKELSVLTTWLGWECHHCEDCNIHISGEEYYHNSNNEEWILSTPKGRFADKTVAKVIKQYRMKVYGYVLDQTNSKGGKE